jgi:hypothetical protein
MGYTTIMRKIVTIIGEYTIKKIIQLLSEKFYYLFDKFTIAFMSINRYDPT